VYEARFDDLLACPSTYFVIVFEDIKAQGKIVASASLVVERKFLRNAGIVGHVEDVVVHPDYKGNSMGKIMLNALKDLALSQGCYKVILDCDPKNVGESRVVVSPIRKSCLGS
jgi:glucosamine-phosphate N-acetyltransferase